MRDVRTETGANVFMRPFEIYRAALYNVYGGLRVTVVPNKIYIYGLRAFNSSMWGSLRLAPIITSDMQDMMWGEPELSSFELPGIVSLRYHIAMVHEM